jgi:hypothetical protein
MHYPARTRVIRGDRANGVRQKNAFGGALAHIARIPRGSRSRFGRASRGWKHENLTALVQLEAANQRGALVHKSSLLPYGRARQDESKPSIPFAVKSWQIIADNLSKAGWRWAAFQPSIAAGERFGLLTHIAPTESISLCVRMKS